MPASKFQTLMYGIVAEIQQETGVPYEDACRIVRRALIQARLVQYTPNI